MAAAMTRGGAAFIGNEEHISPDPLALLNGLGRLIATPSCRFALIPLEAQRLGDREMLTRHRGALIVLASRFLPPTRPELLSGP